MSEHTDRDTGEHAEDATNPEPNDSTHAPDATNAAHATQASIEDTNDTAQEAAAAGTDGAETTTEEPTSTKASSTTSEPDDAAASEPDDAASAEVAEHVENGRTFLLNRNYEAAIAAFDKALEIAPESVDAMVGLAEALGRRGETDAAIERYRAAIAIEPRGRALANLAELLLGVGTYASEVEDLLVQAIEEDPDDHKAYVLLADIRTRARSYPEADELLRKGIRRGAELPEKHIFAFYQQWVKELVRDGKPEEAAEITGSAVQFHRGGTHLTILAAGAAEAAGDTEAAAGFYADALETLPVGPLRKELLQKLRSLQP